MKKGGTYVFCAAACLFTTVSSAGTLRFDSPAPGRDGGRIYYYEPDGFDSSIAAPLLVFLHGGDASSPDSAPERYFAEGKGSALAAFGSSPFIIAAPSAPPARDGSRWSREGVASLIDATVSAACRRYRIDPDRIFLGGHSMGAFGAYHLGQVMADRFAGVWISAGGWWEADFRSFLGTPVYIQHGALDCAASMRGALPKPRRHHWTGVSFARAAHELMERDGVAHVYDEHGGGHCLDDPAAVAAARRFVSWALPLRRNPYSAKTALMTLCGSAHPDVETMRRSRWLEIIESTGDDIRVDGIVLKGPDVAWTDAELKNQTYEIVEKWRDDAARIVAENLGGNRFRVVAENVVSFRILLAPPMGDLSRPFTVEAGALGTRTILPEPYSGSADYTAALTWKASSAAERKEVSK